MPLKSLDLSCYFHYFHLQKSQKSHDNHHIPWISTLFGHRNCCVGCQWTQPSIGAIDAAAAADRSPRVKSRKSGGFTIGTQQEDPGTSIGYPSVRAHENGWHHPKMPRKIRIYTWLLKGLRNGDINHRSTLWLFNIAMENGPFIDGLPIENGDFPWLC